MKPERKQLAQDLLVSVASRIKVIDEMLAGQRRSDQVEAIRYMTEIKRNLDKINEIISIS